MILNRNNCKPILILAFLVICGSCTKDTKYPPWNWDEPTKPDPIETKARYIWIDAAANFPDFANSKENIEKNLTKAKEAGFTDVVVDVRPSMGDVLFKTSAVQEVKKLDYWSPTGYTYYERTATWDYLQAFIDAGHKLGLKVNAAINTFVGGNLYSYGLGEQGLLFRDESKKSWATTVNLASGLTNVMDLNADNDVDNTYGTKFLNPANEDVQNFILTIIADLAKYDLDGIFLDRCRYNDFQSDFSNDSKVKFEEYLGHSVENFPNDIIVPGTSYYPLPAKMPALFKDWMAFRAKTIHDFIGKVKTTIKGVNPEIKFGVYVGGWYSTYYEVGVNWASPKYNTASVYPAWANSDYSNYGYADQLDFMLIGAYAGVDNIYGTTEWTCQGFCTKAKTLLQGDVKFAGGPDVGNPEGWTNGGQQVAITKTVDACINAGDGYFVFDMIHVKEYNYWDALKEGIDKYLETTKDK